MVSTFRAGVEDLVMCRLMVALNTFLCAKASFGLWKSWKSLKVENVENAL